MFALEHLNTFVNITNSIFLKYLPLRKQLVINADTEFKIKMSGNIEKYKYKENSGINYFVHFIQLIAFITNFII